MKYILPIFFVLALTFGGDWGALAHAPQIGEETAAATICVEPAHNTLVEVARTEGLGRTGHVLRRFMNSNQCFQAALTGVTIRVIAVADPINTPDGFILYPLEVEPIGGSATKKWFAGHTHKIKGQEA